MSNNSIKCPKCGSNNVVVQVVSETKSERQKHSFWWFLLIGWWLELVLWIFLTVPRLLIALFVPKKQKITTTHKSVAVCQNCGNMFDSAEGISTNLTESNLKTTIKKKSPTTGTIIIMLIIFFPFGLYAMWRYGKTWPIWVKVVISVFFVLVSLGGFNK